MLINQTPWMAALEAQLSALGVINKIIHNSGDNRMLKELYSGWQVDKRILMDAAPFAWSDEAIQAVLAASKSIPLDTEMSAWNLSTPTVFWHFATPLPFQTINDAAVGVRALGFGWIKTQNYGFGMPCHTWLDDPGVIWPLVPSQTWEWHEGATLGSMLEATRVHHQKVYGPGGIWEKKTQIGVDTFMASTEGLSRFVLAGLAWLNQKILTQETEHVERHRRKEFTRTTGRMPEVKTVRLRKVEQPRNELDPEQQRCTCTHARHEHKAHMSGAQACCHFGCGCTNFDEKRVEWSCRWEVDGHWRNQPCGTKHGDRRLTYIKSFLKGPDDKPFRAPAKKVYVVNR